MVSLLRLRHPLRSAPLAWIVLDAAGLQEAYPDWVKMICAGPLTDNDMVGYRNLETYRAQLYERVCAEQPEVARRLRYMSRATLIPLGDWRAGDGRLEGLMDELALVANEARIAPAPSTTPLRKGELAVWNALEGRILTGAELAMELGLGTNGEYVVRNRIAGIRKNRGEDVVKSKRGRGYYRPDAPPPDLMSQPA